MSVHAKLAAVFIEGMSDAFSAGFNGSGKKRKRRNTGIYDLHQELSNPFPDWHGQDPWESPLKSKHRSLFNPFSWWKL
ncbi:hypothetical protein [Elstera sp.]|jgi:hypothetical protein|uniref:hypothetical protein n=1 Tax=Elstera sp. TaxID=1916664 RepID=UPI0037C0E23F